MDKELVEFLYTFGAEPAKELSKRDQEMIKLGWNAAMNKQDRGTEDWIVGAVEEQEIKHPKIHLSHIKSIVKMFRQALKREKMIGGIPGESESYFRGRRDGLTMLEANVEEAKKQERERIRRTILAIFIDEKGTKCVSIPKQALKEND